MVLRRPSGFIEPCQPSKVAAFLTGFETMIEKVRRRRLQ
jgi:hypothetical protein